MTHKMTKNDSTSKTNHQFYVYVASLEALLKKHSAHKSFFQEWQKEFVYKGTANVFYAWCDWAKVINVEDWISGAFIWNRSKKGFDFWSEIEIEWRDLLKQYLKK